MRVSEKNLNRGCVFTGWWVSGLLLSAYDNISFLAYCVGASIFLRSSISPRIAVTVKQCVLPKETMSRGRVRKGWWLRG